TLTRLTDVGVAVGTLGYMASEQVRGEPVDPRSDIFAVGAILYEMLAGAPAFRADSLESARRCTGFPRRLPRADVECDPRVGSAAAARCCATGGAPDRQSLP